MKNMKLRIVIVALMIAIMGVSVANATIAYFTDTETETNTFTVGNVEIKLTPDTADLAHENVYPAQVIEVDSTITNVSDADAVYAAAIIKLENVGGLITAENAANKQVNVTDFLLGGAIANTTDYTKKIVQIDANTVVIYVICNATIAKDASIVLYEDIKIPAKWDVAEMTAFANLTITTTAYATQTAGFNSAAAAIQGAFGGGADASYDVFAPYFA